MPTVFLLLVLLLLFGCAAVPEDGGTGQPFGGFCYCLACGETVLCGKRGSALIIIHACSVPEAPVSILVYPPKESVDSPQVVYGEERAEALNLTHEFGPDHRD